MKMAMAYKRGKRTLLHASSRTTAGVWILSAPVVAADEDTYLGRLILEALDRSQENVPHPTSWEGGLDPLLEVAGTKNWKTFVKSTRCVGIEFETNRVTFLPMKNLGAKDGFVPLEGKRRSSAPVEMELASALTAAFQEAE
jgi:hypothetical protein